jgi:Secretion system C-terminal sorting domain
MKQMLLALFFILKTCLLFGQITVTAANFPAANDTLRYAIDDMPAPSLDAILTPPGGPQTWSLINVNPGAPFTVVYQAATTGKNAARFPGAELVSPNTARENYYNVTTTRFENLGFSGTDQLGLNLDVVNRFMPAFVERRAPMRFFDINQQATNISFAISIRELPDVIRNGIPGISGLVDSVRFRINTQRLDVVDGYGTMQIPAGQFNVLREKRTEYRTGAFDARTPLLGWINIPLTNAPILANALGTDTTVSYHFFSDRSKEPIVVATLNNAQSRLRSVQVKTNRVTVATDNLEAPGSGAISAFPNPAIEWVRFDCANLPANDYTIKIFNIVGRIVWRETHNISGNKSIHVPLDHFKKGTYLYSLTNKEGTVLGTKRLVVLKP